ncbi:MAG: hypothetical protein V4850_24835 [Myxococcota bacterium]
MEKQHADKLKVALAAIRAQPHYFAFAPNVTPKEGKPEALLLVDKARPIKIADFAKLAKAQSGIEPKGVPALIYTGTVVRGKVAYVFSADPRLSKGQLDAVKGQRQLREFAVLHKLTLIAKGNLQLGEVTAAQLAAADAAVAREIASGDEAARAPSDPAQVEAYEARFGGLRAALASPPATTLDPALREKLTLSLLLARHQATKGDHAGALGTMEEASALLASALRAAAGGGPKRAGPSRFAVSQSRLVWDATRKGASKEMARLVNAIVDDVELQAHPEYATFKTKVLTLPALLAPYDEKLLGVLDDVNAATNPDDRARHLARCRETLRGYRAALAANPTLRRLDDNPFVPVSVFATLQKSLDAMAKLVDA